MKVALTLAAGQFEGSGNFAATIVEEGRRDGGGGGWWKKVVVVDIDLRKVGSLFGMMECRRVFIH